MSLTKSRGTFLLSSSSLRYIAGDYKSELFSQLSNLVSYQTVHGTYHEIMETIYDV